MTREEQIIEKGIEYTLNHNPMCLGGDNFAKQVQALNRNYSFEDGAKWADEHPVNVFHDASEEPKDRSHILIYYKYMGDMEFKSYHLNYQCDFKWSELVNIFEVEYWAYLDDLLPKGGEQ